MSTQKQKWIITGGAGFIGCNAVSRLLSAGHAVVVVDNLSRSGAELNIKWLESIGSFEFHRVDVRDYDPLRNVLKTHRDADFVLHLASQVAVTTSVRDPRLDFEVNALGTFNVLESMRDSGTRAAILYSSTNKVYGGMDEEPIELFGGRYRYKNRSSGVNEDVCLDFHSPYGCSKGAADQYVRDYSRIFGIRGVVFRQSCIYGRRQFGVEDQGWVAWFTIAAKLGHDITVYGDGRQVRDVLFVDDLIDAYLSAAQSIDITSGKVYNMGGGVDNQISLLDLISELENLLGRKIARAFADWRPGDQRVFVADVSRAARDFGWRPKTSARAGLKQLFDWVSANQAEIEALIRAHKR